MNGNEAEITTAKGFKKPSYVKYPRRSTDRGR